MKRKLWVLFLGFVLFLVPMGPVARVGQAKAVEPWKLAKQSEQTPQTAKIKAEIGKRLANSKTKVKLKLRSGAEMKGRLNKAGDDDFSFTDEKSKQEMTVSYEDVEQVKGRGGLSLGAKIGIIAVAAVAIVVVAAVVSFHNFDPFKNGIPIALH